MPSASFWLANYSLRIFPSVTYLNNQSLALIMAKTYKEINEKIRQGKAVVVTAEEIISIVKEKGLKKAAQEVDVVTTATFGPMCSSGAVINIGILIQG